MNPDRSARVLALLALMLGFALVVESARAVASESVSGLFSITSLEIEGTNLVLHAEVPSGLEQVTLEMRPALEGSWLEAGTWDGSRSAGAAVFSISRPP